MVWFSVVCGIVSALAWLASAIVTPLNIKPKWGGPPEEAVRAIKAGAALNAIGAFFAALSIGVQALATYLAM